MHSQENTFQRKLTYLLPSTDFLLVLLLSFADVGDTFLKNGKLSLNYMVLQPRQPQMSHMPFAVCTDLY
jgi:hypothetical protein